MVQQLINYQWNLSTITNNSVLSSKNIAETFNTNI